MCLTRVRRRSLEAEREIDEALADDNPWGWVRKRLIGTRGYKPWFRTLFTADQIVMRYRDVNTDLKFLKEARAREPGGPAAAAAAAW